MKVAYLTYLLIITCVVANAQSNFEKHKQQLPKKTYLSKSEISAFLKKHDFSRIFTQTDNSAVYGFIGDNYQRLRIKFISVTKDSLLPFVYKIHGKSMVKNNIDEFNGKIIISNTYLIKAISYGVDDEYKNKGIKNEGAILGTYTFAEDSNQNHTGLFKGTFESDFYIDKNNRVQYDNIDFEADGFTNNQFVGKWTSYKSGITKTCNWGDYRIPNSDKLDIGAGEFSPDDKYLVNGWQSLRDYMLQTGSNYKKAKKIEEAEWWK